MQLIEEIEKVPEIYLKKLNGTDNIWEIRIQASSNNFIATNGFCKKSQKTPPSEIVLAEKRKASDKAFAKNYDENYTDFKVSVMLRELREKAGLTQEELANKMHTQKSAISRIENKSENIRVATLFKFATALGKTVQIRIA